MIARLLKMHRKIPYIRNGITENEKTEKYLLEITPHWKINITFTKYH
jgi:hypothetical protein